MPIVQSCTYCGCTDDRACPGGCYWHRERYCSACAEKHLEQLADAASKWPGLEPGAALELSGRPCQVVDSDETVTIYDHLNVVVFALAPSGVYLAPHYGALEVLPLFREAA